MTMSKTIPRGDAMSAAKPVVATDEDGKKSRYGSVTEFAEEIGVTPGAVVRAIKRRALVRGIWVEYEHEKCGNGGESDA